MFLNPVKIQHRKSGETVGTYAVSDSYSQDTFTLEILLTRFYIKEGEHQ